VGDRGYLLRDLDRVPSGRLTHRYEPAISFAVLPAQSGVPPAPEATGPPCGQIFSREMRTGITSLGVPRSTLKSVFGF
jgi:hypothetical protein